MYLKVFILVKNSLLIILMLVVILINKNFQIIIIFMKKVFISILNNYLNNKNKLYQIIKNKYT
jgi:hypothetical protein